MSNSNKTLSLIVFFMILIAFPLNLSAQSEGMPPNWAEDGFVILSNGDTLPGKINWSLKYVENNPVEIRFTSENGTKKVFNASEIRGFNNFLSVPSMKKGVPVFMNRLLDGRIRIFQNRSATVYTSSRAEVTTKIDGLYFGFVPGDGLYIGPTYKTSYRIIEERTRSSSYFVSKENNALIKVEKENYDDLFRSLFGDCLEIEQELGKNSDLKKFKNFMILAEVYNQLCQSR